MIVHFIHYFVSDLSLKILNRFVNGTRNILYREVITRNLEIGL